MVYFRSVIHILSKEFSLVSEFLRELRDKDIQQDRARFRKNIERIGQIAAYEISKNLNYQEFEVQTPLGLANINMIPQLPVLATILRAGLPLHQGLLNIFDKSESAFISAYRKTKKSGDFIIQMEYFSTPDLDGKIVIISDPMLATGKSMVLCCKELLANYKMVELIFNYIFSIIFFNIIISISFSSVKCPSFKWFRQKP